MLSYSFLFSSFLRDTQLHLSGPITQTPCKISPLFLLLRVPFRSFRDLRLELCSGSRTSSNNLLFFLSLYFFCECTLLVVSSWAPSLVPYLMFASVLLNRATSPYLWPLLGFRGGESYCTLYPNSDYSYTSLITNLCHVLAS